MKAYLKSIDVPIQMMSFQGGWWTNPNIHTPLCAPVSTAPLPSALPSSPSPSLSPSPSSSFVRRPSLVVLRPSSLVLLLSVSRSWCSPVVRDLVGREQDQGPDGPRPLRRGARTAAPGEHGCVCCPQLLPTAASFNAKTCYSSQLSLSCRSSGAMKHACLQLLHVQIRINGSAKRSSVCPCSCTRHTSATTQCTIKRTAAGGRSSPPIHVSLHKSQSSRRRQHHPPPFRSMSPCLLQLPACMDNRVRTAWFWSWYHLQASSHKEVLCPSQRCRAAMATHSRTSPRRPPAISMTTFSPRAGRQAWSSTCAGLPESADALCDFLLGRICMPK